jgi:hypothetical protein
MLKTNLNQLHIYLISPLANGFYIEIEYLVNIELCSLGSEEH